LRVLFGMSNGNELLEIAEKYIHYDKYAAVCFYKIIDLNLNGSFMYIRPLLESALKDENIDIEEILEFYYKRLGFVEFKRQILTTIRELTKRAIRKREPYVISPYDYFIEAMHNIGISLEYVNPMSSENIVMQTSELYYDRLIEEERTIYIQWELPGDPI